MDRRRKGGFGLSLIELLVVLGIIGIISVVSVPFLARAGLFTSSKADLAAREVFNILRAAKIYATTHNVETAVAYGGLLVQDSFLTDQNGQPLVVPVVDSVAVLRRLKRKELDSIGGFTEDQTDTGIFVPLSMREGGFRRLPNGTCVLPDVFTVQQTAGTFSSTGLQEVLIWDPNQEVLISPREDYAVGISGVTDGFPAHRFSPEGALVPDDRLPQQRLRIRVGLLPNADPSDRFFVDPEDAELIDRPTIVFSESVELPVLKLADGTPLDIDVEILLYVATGRVKVAS